MGEVTVSDIVQALDRITGGRVVTDVGRVAAGLNPFVVTKSSDLPGKAVTETPGLIHGDPAAKVRTIAMVMTLTESAIELAAATGVDLLVAHHPIADASNSGGVPLRNYLGLYGLAVVELHEAFHGLHPGIAYLHGHAAFRTEVRYGGVPGNIMFVGRRLPEVKTLGDIIDRLDRLMGVQREIEVLEADRRASGCDQIHETSVAARARILVGEPERPVDTVLHVFPHTGFSPEHLDNAVREHPEIDTVIASISRVARDHPLVVRAEELGRAFVVGNSHAVELYENWMPLARCLEELFPNVKILMFKERMFAIPYEACGNDALRRYATRMAEDYLLPRASEGGEQLGRMAT